MKVRIGSVIMWLLQTGVVKAFQPLPAEATEKVIVRFGFSDDRINEDWKNALMNRMTKRQLDSVSVLKRPVTNEEKDWINLIESKTTRWNSFKDSLEVPFHDVHVPDTVYVLLGFTGVDDGFTYQYNTVCFDLTALQRNYGSALTEENKIRIDRLFAHEYTHLIHKEWVRKNKIVFATFRDSVLWECLYEGIGMYRSLTPKWLPENGELPGITISALAELYPVFTNNLVELFTKEKFTPEDRKRLTANLSRGQVPKKWGAFTIAIWLALEANGDHRNLSSWMEKGTDSVILLARKYLKGNDKIRFEKAYLRKAP